MNRLPVSTMMIIYPLMLFNSMTITTVYSFLPKMVKEFGASEVDAGYNAGLIASSLFASRTFFNIFWGNLSDKIGRKVPLAIAAYGLALTTLAFGFSTNFYWALISRFIQGCFMALNVLCKSIIVDICDDSNFTFGFSILISAGSLGRLLGPCIGGFLAFPCQQYPSVFVKTSLFEKFPILLPMLIISSALAISNTVMIICLPNDYAERKKGNDQTLYSQLPSPSSSNTGNITTSSFSTESLNGDTDSDYESVELMPSSKSTKVDTDSDATYSEKSNLINNNEHTVLIESSSLCSRLFESKLFRALKTKECLASSIMYAVYSFTSVGNSETFPLFVATATNLRGLAFTTAQIGTVLLISSFFLIIFQFTIQHRIGNFVGPKKMLIYAMLGLVFLFPILPSLAAVRNNYILWISLCLWLIPVRMLIAISNLSVNIFIKNSVTSDLLGSAMGLGQAANSVGSMLSPSVYGSIYAWSLKNVSHGNNSSLRYPFNQYFIFLLQSLWAIFIAVLTSHLPKSMERKKELNN